MSSGDEQTCKCPNATNEYHKCSQYCNDRYGCAGKCEKKKPKDQELNYKFGHERNRYQEDLSLSDCEDQLREWASELAQREIERRPEGKKLKDLKDLKVKALDVVMESGTPDSLALALDNVSKKIGLRWNQDLQALPNFKQ